MSLSPPFQYPLSVSPLLFCTVCSSILGPFEQRAGRVLESRDDNDKRMRERVEGVLESRAPSNPSKPRSSKYDVSSESSVAGINAAF
mmetsp:Transcript_30809/g.42681  ORF Transcript_30809/g.42681 Transcript_30809/m.42681 type:complete len:87 (-) Transcript_30809:152-412(-)